MKQGYTMTQLMKVQSEAQVAARLYARAQTAVARAEEYLAQARAIYAEAAHRWQKAEVALVELNISADQTSFAVDADEKYYPPVFPSKPRRAL